MESSSVYDTCEILDASCHIGNLFTGLIEFFSWILKALLGALVQILGWIPVPSFLTSNTFALPDGVMWFASALEVNTGLALVMSAYTLRFVLRRIPLFG